MADTMWQRSRPGPVGRLSARGACFRQEELMHEEFAFGNAELMHEEFAFGNADGFHEVGVSTEPDACAALLEIIA